MLAEVDQPKAQTLVVKEGPLFIHKSKGKGPLLSSFKKLYFSLTSEALSFAKTPNSKVRGTHPAISGEWFAAWMGPAQGGSCWSHVFGWAALIVEEKWLWGLRWTLGFAWTRRTDGSCFPAQPPSQPLLPGSP